MKSKFIDTIFKYDGTQLKNLFAYTEYEVLGDSIVSWRGPCDVGLAEMVDGEDFLQKSKICGDDMLHFIVEKFNTDLISGVLLQRLLASICIDTLSHLSTNTVENLNESGLIRQLRRSGDDIYVNDQKLSISVATVTPVSTLIHFAVNISNNGTPVSTISLEDFKIDHKILATELMKRFVDEVTSVTDATQKVFPR